MADNYWDDLMATDEGAAQYMLTYGEGPGSDTRKLIGQFINDDESVLDVGCGPGWNYEHFVQYGPDVKRYVGVDYSKRFIRVCKKRQPDIEWVVGDCRDIQFDEDSFDVVILQDCLEHTSGYEIPLKEALRVARKRVIVTFWKASFMDDNESEDKINDDGNDGYGATYNRDRFEKYLDDLGVEWWTDTTKPGANRWHRIYILEVNDEIE
jgi:SAM-dependent methyltransferase